jgi:hypothetical protein
VWHAGGVVKASDCAGEDTEALLLGGFFAAFEEGLESEADTEEQDAGVDAFNEGVSDVEFIQGPEHLAEVAYPGEDDAVCIYQALGVIDKFIGHSDLIERVLN